MRADGLGDAEIDDLDDSPPVLIGDQNVGGLQVAVQQAFLVGVLDPLAHLHE